MSQHTVTRYSACIIYRSRGVSESEGGGRKCKNLQVTWEKPADFWSVQEEQAGSGGGPISPVAAGAVSSDLPQIGFVIKAADQGSLEAILQWIHAYNKTVKDAEELPEVVQESLRAAAKERVRALEDCRRTVALAGAEDEPTPDQDEQQLQESERVLRSRWAPLCVVHAGVGSISLSDVKKASLTNSFVFGFSVPLLEGVDQVRCPNSAGVDSGCLGERRTRGRDPAKRFSRSMSH